VATAALDATDRAAVDALFGEKDSLDHLILSFGAARVDGLFTALSMAELTNALTGKLVAYLSVLQAALRLLRADGSVTFVGAVLAEAALPGTAGLAAANGGLHAAVPPLARELAPLRVNAVAPGLIETPYWEAIPEPARAQVFQHAANAPAGRVGRPKDVAHVVAMLIDCSYVTGTVIPCDGGLRLS
jgi:NAD(P)-dependent dehydrogenase (short-subunit alcohol dehydrogenase family)